MTPYGSHLACFLMGKWRRNSPRTLLLIILRSYNTLLRGMINGQEKSPSCGRRGFSGLSLGKSPILNCRRMEGIFPYCVTTIHSRGIFSYYDQMKKILRRTKAVKTIRSTANLGVYVQTLVRVRRLSAGDRGLCLCLYPQYRQNQKLSQMQKRNNVLHIENI